MVVPAFLPVQSVKLPPENSARSFMLVTPSPLREPLLAVTISGSKPVKISPNLPSGPTSLAPSLPENCLHQLLNTEKEISDFPLDQLGTVSQVEPQFPIFECIP